MFLINYFVMNLKIMVSIFENVEKIAKNSFGVCLWGDPPHTFTSNG